MNYQPRSGRRELSSCANCKRSTKQGTIIADADGKSRCALNTIRKGLMCRNLRIFRCNFNYSSQTKIVGGMETGVNEYPMMAGLVDPLERDVYCGATIISERHVITAAHCLTDRDINNVGVLVGDHDLSTGKNAFLSKILKTLFSKANFSQRK